MIVKNLLATCLALVLTSGCGGGGGDSSQNMVSEKISAYVGNYTSCNQQGKLEKITITKFDNSTLQVETSADWYSNNDCTGLAVAYENYTSPYYLGGFKSEVQHLIR